MTYQLLNVPNLKAFNKPEESNRAEVNELFDWFMENKDTRIQILELYVQSFENFKNWKADYTPNSLIELNKWFAQIIQTRPISPEEIAEETSKLQDKFKFLHSQIENAQVLDETSISISYDIGIYFGEVLRKTYPNLTWTIRFSKSNSDESNQPILGKFMGDYFNPRFIERGVRKVKNDPNHLLNLFKVWSNFAVTKN